MNCVTYKDKQISPSKVVCIGRNYVDHIAELDNEVPSQPVIFVKPNSAITQHLSTHLHDEIHYEAEICFLVENNQYCAVGLGLDLTKRQIQTSLKEKGLPWERAKAFDRSAVFSHFIALPKDLHNIYLTLTINGDVKQQGGYELMLYKPNAILKEIHQFMSTVDGDIVMTGTPKGVGVVKAGDIFKVSLHSAEQCLLEHEWIASPHED